MEAQALQMRLFDLNAIMPGALRKLDHSHVAAAAARQVSATSCMRCTLTCMTPMLKVTVQIHVFQLLQIVQPCMRRRKALPSK